MIIRTLNGKASVEMTGSKHRLLDDDSTGDVDADRAGRSNSFLFKPQRSRSVFVGLAS
jgi:hypothetical protein